MDAPVVLIGDWNLVGSRTPLTLGEDAGFEQVPMLQLGGGTSATWVSEYSDFSPGRLDLAAHQATDNGAALDVARAYVLNTRVLNERTLGAMGLEAGDSEASDHLMLVADFLMD